MNLKQIRDLAIRMGEEALPFGGKNFSDCQVINLGQIEVKTIYVGIDIGVGELLLVDKLRSTGTRIDAVISHHPLAGAAYGMAEVARIQQKNWVRLGVEEQIAREMVDDLIEKARMEAGSHNHLRARDAARLMGIPLLSLHTALDNLVQAFFNNLLKSRENQSLEKVLKTVQQIEECRMAAADGVEPYLTGKVSSEACLGRYMVDMTGGLDPPSEIFSHLKKAGIDTVVGMHYGMDNIQAMEEEGIAALICGHMAGDSIGINLFCDRLASRGIIIIAGSGLYRVKRLHND